MATDPQKKISCTARSHVTILQTNIRCCICSQPRYYFTNQCSLLYLLAATLLFYKPMFAVVSARSHVTILQTNIRCCICSCHVTILQTNVRCCIKMSCASLLKAGVHVGRPNLWVTFTTAQLSTVDNNLQSALMILAPRL